MSFTEKILSFGPGETLHGILTEPPAGRRVEGAPAILTWNVGLHHHIGPHRYFVDLARVLAEAGFTSLRFDVSGLGDSEIARDDARPDAERAVADVRSAMNALKTRGFQQFVPIGFCSSVDAAHAISVTDSEIVGVIYLEGYGIRTRGFYLHYYKRFLERNRWERLLRQKYPKLFGEQQALADATLERERVYVREYPTQAKLSEDIRQMMARGVRLLLVYVGGDTDYGYPEQFFEMIGGRPAGDAEVVFYRDADHTFFLETDRRRVIARIRRWLTKRYGVPAAEGPNKHNGASLQGAAK
jgi:alpha-beta hydrolase superfamily lysophospholipase